MTVMITGGAGFVGLNITELLLRQARTVLSFGLEAPPQAALREFEKLPGNLLVHVADVRDRDALLAAMQKHGVQQLVHGAAITAGPAREAEQAPLIAAVNFGGTIEVLEAAVRHRVKRVVQLGSGSVFGSSVKNDGFLVEDEDIPVPDSLYGITKYAAERTGLRYRAARGLDLVAARLGVVFGRWEYDTGVRDTLSIPLKLTTLAEQGGHASFCRNLPDDWVYATDVADAVVRLLDASGAPQPVYHISSGSRWSSESWCERLRRVYPNFSYSIVEKVDQANVGNLAPSPRPPFSVARIAADVGFKAAFLELEAFADYVGWRRETLKVSGN
jgi:nucleoside-diphosphate-sugar epimerase